jgi:hypothetical protein
VKKFTMTPIHIGDIITFEHCTSDDDITDEVISVNKFYKNIQTKGGRLVTISQVKLVQKLVPFKTKKDNK